MSLPFYFRGKLCDALALSEEKQRLERELCRPKVRRDRIGRMQPTEHKTVLIGSGKLSELHGEDFFSAWDETFMNVRKQTNIR